MASELDAFITSQARLNTLSKKQSKSINLLQLQYKALNKILGPFYTQYVDLKNTMETLGEVKEELTGATENLTKATDALLGPIGIALKVFRNMNTILLFLLGGFTLLGGAVFLLSKQFGGGEGVVDSFNTVLEAGRGLIDSIITTFGQFKSAIEGLDLSMLSGALLPALEGVVGFLGNILKAYIAIYTAVIAGIGDIVERMAEAGFLQKIVDAIGVFIGLVAMAFGIIKDNIDATGVTFDGIIEFITSAINGFVDFLFSSGLIKFVVKFIELLAVVYGAVAVLAAQVISVFIRIWGRLGPPIIKFVKAFFNFLNPIVRIVTGVLGDVIDKVLIFVGKLTPVVEGTVDTIMEKLEKPIELIEKILGFFGGGLEKAGDFLSGKADELGYATGGIASGPTSGYPVTLHGTEAIVPLPDGRTIPVSIKGDMMGKSSHTNNISINVSGGGNAKEIAKAVSDEVSKVLRNRSRGGSYTRGVI
jgi:phage-related protein